ncbi:MAG: prephenate dehydrogenase/arogenate dehydrogenase family protein [Candidatus Levyibacteriota bacterium]
MQKITIIGFGRFGQTLYRLLKSDFDVLIYTRKSFADKSVKQTQSLEEAYTSSIIFHAVPIAAFETVISEHKKYFRDDHTLIDVLSVKHHPAVIFERYLIDTKTQALLTHPMFGPDSSKDSFDGLPIVLDRFRTDKKTYTFWKKYFNEKQLRVIELTADQHDQLAANSQGITHFIGRMLDEFAMQKTAIDTTGAKKLLEVKEQTCNDTWELFTNLQQYNPYTKDMRIRLGEAYDALYNKLIPKQKTKKHLTIGIQGGKGSFNEEAIYYYLKRNKITEYKINYLYTSKNVMQQLHEGDIDLGLMATHNSIGGIVMETIEALAHYKCAIVEDFAIKIAHTLMIRPDARLQDVDTIMAHPQVFAQCKETLMQKYPQLKQTSGEGELIDHALVAKHLAEKKLPKNIATMGSKILADIYGLTIIEENLQDSKNNYTSFLLIER